MPRTLIAAIRAEYEARRKELIALRQKLGLSQDAMAARMAANRQTYRAWENGRNGISPQIIKLARLSVESDEPIPAQKPRKKPGRPGVSLNDPRFQQVVALREQGLSMGKIAKEIGTYPSWVFRCLQRVREEEKP